MTLLPISTEKKKVSVLKKRYEKEAMNALSLSTCHEIEERQEREKTGLRTEAGGE